MGEENKIMSIVLEDGSIDEVEKIFSFKFVDTNTEYLVYTKNETDENGNVTVYIASVDRSNGGEPRLGSVDSEEEWARIKNVLKEMSKPVE